MSAPLLHRLALLSVLAAVITIAMKTVAWQWTGSAGLLSDALESGVNLLAAGTAYFSLIYAARPADATHTFGHEKIEFFASGLEGVLIVLAGVGTIYLGCDRLLDPQPLERLDIGIMISAAATAINLAVALILRRAAKRHTSLILAADAEHLLADVYTTVGILIGLGMVTLTGWNRIDGILALIVGTFISITGSGLIRRSFNGLMDHALPLSEQQQLRDAIRDVLPANADFHALRTRLAGHKTFAEFHLLVPGRFSVSEAHTLAHRVEDSLSVKFPDLAVTIHIEPIDEVTSFETTELKLLGEPVPVPLPEL